MRHCIGIRAIGKFDKCHRFLVAHAFVGAPTRGKLKAFPCSNVLFVKKDFVYVRAQFILAHTAAQGERHAHSHNWNRAFGTGLRQLQAVDAIHGTNLAPKAQAAWEGPNSLVGTAVSSAGSNFATKSCYWDRTYPLRLLNPGVGVMWINYTIGLYLCPRIIWETFFATSLVFSAVDELFTEYLNSHEKSLANHQAPG